MVKKIKRLCRVPNGTITFDLDKYSFVFLILSSRPSYVPHCLQSLSNCICLSLHSITHTYSNIIQGRSTLPSRSHLLLEGHPITESIMSLKLSHTRVKSQILLIQGSQANSRRSNTFSYRHTRLVKVPYWQILSWFLSIQVHDTGSIRLY